MYERELAEIKDQNLTKYGIKRFNWLSVGIAFHREPWSLPVPQQDGIMLELLATLALQLGDDELIYQGMQPSKELVLGLRDGVIPKLINVTEDPHGRRTRLASWTAVVKQSSTLDPLLHEFTLNDEVDVASIAERLDELVTREYGWFNSAVITHELRSMAREGKDIRPSLDLAIALAHRRYSVWDTANFSVRADRFIRLLRLIRQNFEIDEMNDFLRTPIVCRWFGGLGHGWTDAHFGLFETLVGLPPVNLNDVATQMLTFDMPDPWSD